MIQMRGLLVQTVEYGLRTKTSMDTAWITTLLLERLRRECRELCRGKPGCYAVTYDTGERCFHRSCIAMKNALFSCIPVPIASGILFLSSCANGFIAACAGCSRCYLKKIPKGLVPVDVEMSVSVRLCANETTPEGKRYDCGQWLLDYSFRGTKSLF
jgi:hypothetical protein